jgi:hypothetical protein
MVTAADIPRCDTNCSKVGLACIKKGANGGGSRLVSVVLVHDQIAKSHLLCG